MKSLLKTLILLVVMPYLLHAQDFCGSLCTVKLDKDKGNPTEELQCKVSTIPIIAYDVFEGNTTTLKTYFGTGETVCDVLGWMNEGVSSLSEVDGLAGGYNRTIKLQIRHEPVNRFGGSYSSGFLTLDSDPKAGTPDESDLMSGEEGFTDGNDFAEIMKYMVVHEFFHYVQERTQILYVDKDWVLEGTARMFEDIVYDGKNPYLHSAYSPMFTTTPYIADRLNGGINNGGDYKSFPFWKLMQDKCTLDMGKMLKSPLDNFHTVANSCSGVPSPNGDKLAGLFVQYNWTMLQAHDFSKIDSNEPAFTFGKFKHNKLKEVNQPNFTKPIDMKSKVGGSIPAFGAKSFFITEETLLSCDDLSLKFDGGDLKLYAVRVDKDGNSNVDNGFALKSGDTPYELTREDRKGGLFVTVTNTTTEKVVLKTLSLSKANGKRVLPKPGAIEVTLTWDNPAIDFDLNVGWKAGEHDVKDTGCPMEHFYVKSHWDIYPGDYPIRITHKKEDDNESGLIPTKLKLIVSGASEKVGSGDNASYTPAIYEIDINNTADLDLGHVADIHVEYINGEYVFEVEGDFILVPLSIGGKGTNAPHGKPSWIPRTYYQVSSGEHHNVPIEGEPPCNMSCGCMPCEYTVIPYLEQLLYGPLSGSDLALYEAVDYTNKTALYVGKTTSGNTLYTAGNIEVPREVVDTLDDDTFYLLVAQGGLDLDHNDDMILDDLPTVNNGEMHLLLTGKDIKEIGFKANVLTEIAYQIVKDMVDVNTTEEVKNKLDEVALRILNDKVYGDENGTLGYRDLSFWLPTLHRRLLIPNYNQKIVPFIENVFANRDVEQEAYDIVYAKNSSVPILQTQRYDIDENITNGNFVGKITVLNTGTTPIHGFSLVGDGHENFEIDNEGTITVADTATLDYERKTYYKLYVIAVNDDGRSVSTKIIIQLHNIADAPEMTNYQASELFEDTAINTEVFRFEFNSGNSELQTAVLSGNGKEYFQTEVVGNIVYVKVAKTLLNYLNKRAYELSVKVSNETQSGRDIPFVLIIGDRRDIPRLANTRLYVDENTAKDTIVGNINVISDGDSPIDRFEIIKDNYSYMHWPDGYFVIDRNGTIKIDANASLDYESKANYSIYVKAINAMGESKKAVIQITLNNIPDALPTCSASPIEIGPISKSIEIGTTLKTVTCYQTDSPIISAKLNPSSPFEAILLPTSYQDTHIDIRLVDSLENINISEYNLSFSVTSSTGESNIVPVHITISENNYIFEMYEGDYNTILGQIDIDSNKTISYTNTSNGLFSVDKNGTVRRNNNGSNRTFTSQHAFVVTIKYEDGTSEEVSVVVNVESRIISRLDTPGVLKGIVLNQAKTRAYLADYDRGIHIADISDVNNPIIIASLETDGAANDVVLSKDEKYIYLLDVGKGLKVIDISDDKLQVVSMVDIGGYSFNIELSADGNYAYVSHDKQGIEVIDISNPHSPEIVNNIGFLGVVEKYDNGVVSPYAKYVKVSLDGTRLFVADYSYGLQVIDITDIENPKSIYSETLINGKYGYSADYLWVNEKKGLVSAVKTYQIANDGTIDKFGQGGYSGIELLDGHLAYNTISYGIDVYDAYNPSKMSKRMYINLGQTYGMVLGKEQQIAFVANGTQGLTLVSLEGIGQPIHKEPIVLDTVINIMENDIPNITVGDSIGQVRIWESGDSQIVNTWIDAFRYRYGDGDGDIEVDEDCNGLDGSDPYYLRCENDYTYFNIDMNGSIMINDTKSLAYSNIGNQAPFASYVENENGKKSNQATVLVKIKENPDWTMKFQKSIIKIDSNVSVGSSIGNVLLKKSKRELFLFDMYEHKNPEYESCDRDSFYDNYDYQNPDSIYGVCNKLEYFSIDTNGSIMITQIPSEGNYTFNIFAVDRFGIRVLENQTIEVFGQ